MTEAHNLASDAQLVEITNVLQIAKISEYAKGVVAFRKSDDAYRYAVPENIVSLASASVPALEELTANAEARGEFTGAQIKEILEEIYTLLVSSKHLAAAVAGSGSSAVDTVDAEIRQKAKAVVAELDSSKIIQVNEVLVSLLDIYTSYHVETLKLY